MVTSRIRRPHRAGFTLIELLVVIALIATLAALSAGAFFRVRAGQMKSASEATLVKLNTALDNRWKAIQESVGEDKNKNTIPFQQALRDAGGNPDVARSLLMYAKVKNELPMSFAEARGTLVAAPPDGLPPNRYYTVVGSIHIGARTNFSVLPASAANYEEQSAICFYLAVTSSGGGGAMTDGDGLQQQTADAPSFPGLKLFKDAWGLPIVFVRHAYTPEVDQPPFVRNAAATNKDPFDPAGKLPAFMTAYPVVWSNIMAYTANTPGSANIPATYQGNRNFVPTLVSFGPNKQPEGNLFGGTDNDNLLSYRLRREGNRGD